MPGGLACSVWIDGVPGLAHGGTASLGKQPSPLVGALAGRTDNLLSTKW